MIDYRIQMIDWMKMNLAVYFLLLSLPKEIKTKDRKYGKAYEPEQKALAKAMQWRLDLWYYILYWKPGNVTDAVYVEGHLYPAIFSVVI